MTSFNCPRAAALALLNAEFRLTRKAGSFLGQLAAEPGPLSDAQESWIATLLERGKLPPLSEGGLS